MTPRHPPPTTQKVCFVTIGATAAFAQLVQAALQPAFVRALASHGYTSLIVQYGADGQRLYADLVAQLPAPDASGVAISGFPVDKAGLGPYFLLTKGSGVVVSHAGTGTVLDAMRVGVPVVVVPNESLLDNHQVELAEALSAEGYVVRGRVGNLASALGEAEELRARLHSSPPANSGPSASKGGSGSLAAVMDEEMGFTQLD